MSSKQRFSAETERVSLQAASWFRSVYSVPEEDLKQQAALLALETQARYPDQAAQPGYLYSAVRRSLGNYVSKEVTIVSISGNWAAGKENAGRASLYRPEEDGSDGAEERFSSPFDSPEDVASEAERLRLKARWRVDFIRVVNAAMKRAAGTRGPMLAHLRTQAANTHASGCLRCFVAARNGGACEVGSRLRNGAVEALWGTEAVDLQIVERKFGLDGEEDTWKDSEIAQRLGVPVARVYRVWELLAKELRGSVQMFLLARRLKELR